MISFVVLYHADGQALTLQLLDSLTNGFVVLGGYTQSVSYTHLTLPTICSV